MGQPIDRAYVEVLPDLKRFDKEATKEIKAALADAGKEADKAAAKIEESLTDAMADAAKVVKRTIGGIEREISEIDGVIKVKMVVDDKEVIRTLKRDVNGKIRNEKGQFASTGELLGLGLADGVSSGLFSGLKGLSGIGSTIGSAISAAGPYVQSAAITLGVSAAAALAPAVAALGLALPAAAGVGAAAIGTLVLGFQGLGDAIENAGDPEKFAEALEKLSPAAQRFAIEIKNLLPLLRSIKMAAQEGIFKGFEGEITRVVTTLQGPLRIGFNDVGRAINDALFGLTGFAMSAKGIEGINAVFSTTADIIRSFAPVINPLLSGMTDLVLKALPFVEKLSSAFAGFLDDLGVKLSSIAGDGTLDEIFSSGLDVLTRVWDVASQLWDVFKGLFGVALTSSGPLLDALQQMAVALGDFFRDKDNLEALGVLFQGLGYVIQGTTFSIKLALKVITYLVDAVKAVVQWVPKAASAVGDFGKAVGHWFADAYHSVTGFFVGVGKWLGDTADSIGKWFSSSWKKASDATSSGIDSVLTFFRELPGKIGDFLSTLPGLLVGLLKEALAAALQEVGVGIGLLVYAFWELPKQIPGALAKLGEVVSAFFVNLWRSVYTWTVSAWTDLLAWFAALPGRVLSAIFSLGNLLGTFFTNLWTSVSTWTVNAWSSMLAWFTALPGRVVAAVSSLGSMLASFFAQLWSDVRTWAVNGWNSVIAWIQSVPGRIASLGQTFYNAGLGLIRGFFNGLSSAASFAGGVGNAIFGAFKSGLNWAIRQINSGIATVDDVLPGSLPRIPQLAQGGLALGPSMIGEAGKEIALPLQGQRGKKALELLAAAANGGGSGAITFGPGSIAVSFEGAVPSEQEARMTGEALGRGILGVIAQRNARMQIRTA